MHLLGSVLFLGEQCIHVTCMVARMLFVLFVFCIPITKNSAWHIVDVQ